ncbi:uncharacterized protein LOC128210751 [Mya arenaria]|uniref:uncharacterized protein LOC128210751 n=1 Tax=Mya arenaria TaxID=6604 RepID=UPI0022E79263|nr:uncharacterized protein LOC128210751 [Mya arenaria]
MALENQKMFQTIAAIELYHAQREVANYLELAYLHLADHTDVAREVRMTAHSARTQHLMTSGLMKKFTATSFHIVKTMIPIILDAVELQDRDIIIEAFGQIIENAETMKKESEDTRTSYLNIQTDIQRNLASVNDRNKDIVDKKKKIEIEKLREEEMAKAAQLAQKELDQERKRIDDELKTLKSYRDRMYESADAAGKAMTQDNDTTFMSSVGPSEAMVGPSAFVMTIATSLGNILTNVFKGDRKMKMYKELQKNYQASEENVHRASQERRQVIDRVNEQRKEALIRLAKLKELTLQEASLGNVESLREASMQLGAVDKQFTRIILFWENMAATLKFLKEDVKSGEVYLKKIEEERYAERFKKSIGKAERDWRFFGRICSDYVQESDTQINHLYNFLSSPVDHMSTYDRDKRQQAILDSIESDIASAFGDTE